MLAYYLAQTQRLLQNPAAPVTLYSTADLTSYINTARSQIAGEGRCIRRIGTLTTTIGTRLYPFSSIVFTGAGVQGAINVRSMLYSVGTGMKWVNGKSFEWFQYFRLNNPVPTSGAPTEWSQHAQGSAGVGAITNVGAGTMSSGSFFIDPLPDLAYTLNLDCAAYPIALAADTDAEAIPFMWSDCVAYFAAYLALDDFTNFDAYPTGAAVVCSV